MNKGDRCEVLIGKPRRWVRGVIERDDGGGVSVTLEPGALGVTVLIARANVRLSRESLELDIDDGPEVEDTLP